MNTRVKFGFIGAAIAIGLFLINYALGLPEKLSYTTQEILGHLTMILALMVIVLAILEVRRKEGGNITFGRALGVGMTVALIAGVVFGIGITIMLAVQGEQVMVDMLEKGKEGIIASTDLSETEKQAKLAQMDMMANSIFMTPWFNGILMFGHMIVYGLVISLITGLALKRNQ